MLICQSRFVAARETVALPQDERSRLLSALSATNWNKYQAARQLHWSRMTLYRKMAKYHIINSERVLPTRQEKGMPGQKETDRH